MSPRDAQYTHANSVFKARKNPQPGKDNEKKICGENVISENRLKNSLKNFKPFQNLSASDRFLRNHEKLGHGLQDHDQGKGS